MLDQFIRILKTLLMNLPWGIGDKFIVPLLQRLFLFLFTCLCFCLLLAIRILSPVIKIRLAFPYTGRIGHIALDFDIFLCDRLKHPEKYSQVFVLFFSQNEIANPFLLSLWQKKQDKFLILKNKIHIAKWLVSLNEKRKICQDLVLELNRTDNDGVTIGMPPLLTLENNFQQQCENKLYRVGVEKKIVCIHNRDSAYEMQSNFTKYGDLNVHDYRNSSVGNYKSTMEALIARDYSIVRISRIAEKQAPAMTGAFDYAFSSDFQSDELDVYLLATAEFFISSVTGISHIPTIFRKRQLVINSIPFTAYLLTSLTPQSLFIPKLLWCADEKRLLTFSEMLRLNIDVHSQECPYRSRGLEPIENTPDEICDAAIEMDDRINQKDDAYAEYDSLQRLFWELTPNTSSWDVVRNKFKHRISSTFLFAHKDLLK